MLRCPDVQISGFATSMTNGALTYQINDGHGATSSAASVNVQRISGSSLTGSSGSDIIIGDQSNSCTISGGDGHDWLLGGTNADSISGGEGNDYLSGGPGADVLMGGSGKDAINTGAPGTGRQDRVSAGPGKDSIVAVGTRAKARINCGAGFDTVRIVPAERRYLRGCERVLVVR